MRCCKRIDAYPLRVLAALVLAAVLVVAAIRPGQAASLDELRVQRTDAGLLLYAQMQFKLAPAVRDALEKGIPLYFVTTAQVVRRRWYWSDQELALAHRYARLAYQPLTRRWRINVSGQPIAGAAPGLTSRYYESMDEALAAVQQIAGWQVATSEQLADGGHQVLEFRFRLDSGRLPRTLQLGALGDSDWRLSFHNEVDLGDGETDTGPEPEPRAGAEP